MGRGTFVARSDGTAEFLFTRMGDMHTAFSGLSVSKICRAPSSTIAITTTTTNPSVITVHDSEITTSMPKAREGVVVDVDDAATILLSASLITLVATMIV